MLFFQYNLFNTIPEKYAGKRMPEKYAGKERRLAQPHALFLILGIRLR